MSGPEPPPTIVHPVPRRPFGSRPPRPALATTVQIQSEDDDYDGDEARRRWQQQRQQQQQQQKRQQQSFLARFSRPDSTPTSPQADDVPARALDPLPQLLNRSRHPSQNQLSLATNFASATVSDFTDPGAAVSSPVADAIDRSQSFRNLTGSTLFGIFSQSVAEDSAASAGGRTPRSGFFQSGTPYGTGAETPTGERLVGSKEDEDGDGGDEGDNADGNTSLDAADIDEIRQASRSLLMLQQKRRRGDIGGLNPRDVDLPPARDSSSASSKPAQAVARPQRQPAVNEVGRTTVHAFTVLSVVSRAALLFALGMGYGVLVSRLHNEAHGVFASDEETGASTTENAAAASVYDPTQDWRYLASWGFSGVVLGALLPWFDGVWAHAFSYGSGLAAGDTPLRSSRAASETDWALVVRGIGAFAGIVFAIRKLPWASTMQASLTLALVNPFLWYLIDRSKPGFILASAFGLVGSIVLMILQLDLALDPSGAHLHSQTTQNSASSFHGGSTSSLQRHNASDHASTVDQDPAYDTINMAHMTATVETAIWLISVLFCSCVCFGNIGRRLALQQPIAAVRGRLAEEL